MGHRHITSLLAVALLATGLPAQDPPRAGGDMPFDRLPADWTPRRRIDVPPAALNSFGRRLGGRVTAITNRFYAVRGQTVRINMVTCPDESNAAAVERSMMRLGVPVFVRRDGVRVFEFKGRRYGDFRTALEAFGCDRVSYQVRMLVGLVDDAQGVAANRVFNLFIARRDAAAAEKATIDARIREISKAWPRRSTLRLFTPRRPGLRVEIVEAPGAASRSNAGEFTDLVYPRPPELVGIPYAQLTLKVMTSEAQGKPESKTDQPGRIAATKYWPSSDPVFEKAARDLGDTPADHRARAVQTFVRNHVRYGGATGSRVGAKAALRAGRGHCWDASDVLCTLARAAGLPSRQLAGWLEGVSGHVWSEVWVEGRGWLPMDGTLPFSGVTNRHIPYFASDDGDLSILYLAMPEVRRLR